MMLDKRGQNSTIGVTIAIVLGVALIVFLIWGFSTNWAMFRSTSGAYAGSTVDIVKNACKRQCENGYEAEFCQVKKKVIDTNGKAIEARCIDPPISESCDAFNCDTKPKEETNAPSAPQPAE